MDDTTKAPDEHSVETAPPRTDEHGFALDGDLPLNIRLRAEAMVNQGLTDDPQRIVDADLLASTATRLKAADDAAKADVPSLDMTKAELVDHAAQANVDVASGDTKAAILDKINTAADAASTEA